MHTMEAGTYVKERLNELCSGKITFLIFYSSVAHANVASGTRTLKLTSLRKAIMPNVLRIVQIVQQVKGRQSVPKILNMLHDCPASQCKSLSGLDNMVAERFDSFDF